MFDRPLHKEDELMHEISFGLNNSINNAVKPRKDTKKKSVLAKVELQKDKLVTKNNDISEFIRDNFKNEDCINYSEKGKIIHEIVYEDKLNRKKCIKKIFIEPKKSIWSRYDEFYSWYKNLLLVFVFYIIYTNVYYAIKTGVYTIDIQERDRISREVAIAQKKYELNLCHIGPPVDLIEVCKQLDIQRNILPNNYPLLFSFLKLISSGIKQFILEISSNYLVLFALLSVLLIFNFRK